MKRPDDTGFENRELSIDELDSVAGGGLFSWVAHEMIGGREVARLGIRQGRECRGLRSGQQPRQHHHSQAELSGRIARHATSGPSGPEALSAS